MIADATDLLAWGLAFSGLSSGAVLFYLYLRERERGARKAAEQEALRRAGEIYREISENNGQAYWLLDLDSGSLVYLSRSYEELFGVARAEAYANPRSFIDRVHPEDRARVEAALLREATEGRVDTEYRVVLPSGELRWIWSRIFPATRSGEGKRRVVGVAEDVTARKRAEAELSENEKRLYTLFQYSPFGIVEMDMSGVAEELRAVARREEDVPAWLRSRPEEALRITRRSRTVEGNDRSVSMLGVTSRSLGAEGDVPGLLGMGAEQAADVLGKLADGMTSFSFEVTGRPRRGTAEAILVSLAVVPTHEESLDQVIVTLADVSELSRKEAELRATLADRDALIREIYHRAMNNMQVMIGLLDLYSLEEREAAVRRAFSDMQNRILSMSLVHKRLYATRRFAEVDLADYLREFAATLAREEAARDRGIEIRVETESILLPIDSAMPSALVVNELARNALRHAFVERGGVLQILLRRAGEAVELVVRDDGRGLAGPEGAGLRTARLIAETQLGGSLEIADLPGRGMECRLLLKPRTPICPDPAP